MNIKNVKVQIESSILEHNKMKKLSNILFE